MITLSEVDQQLKNIGVSFRYWGRAELKELAQIMVPGETIHACINGRYEGGFATLCATSFRLLLIDKKPFHLSTLDIRYDMIAEVDFGSQMMSASLRIITPSKNLTFMSFKPKVLRATTFYLQHKVMEVRQQFNAPHSTAEQTAEPVLGLPAAENILTGEQIVAPQQLAEQPNSPQIGSINLPVVPLPRFKNPYTQAPLLMRRKVGGKFGPAATPQQ